ncbi:hypothetical protein MUN82_16770 [Hymenobacter aerilatus]|uniref:Outer membrane protein beta-barrel domain-containing protein n=1 Tax=Hymenobacter aerilatus TaxID=2932251 RepID=A0A8T9SR16_9BACT|nr:hypothetical protein [Hymenobacter aerilatus]UOR04588.1 hypothetical protein MUN82_16770 [Hymenobacter aerilatus]
MKLLYLSSLLLTLLSINAYAQLPAYQHSVSIGFERVGLDAPDDIGNRYLGRYARHLAKNRLMVEAGLGYMSVLNRRNLPMNDYFVDGKRRKRVTGDLTLSFDFLKTLRHAFRIGVGPSLWYRKDQILDSGRFTIGSDGSISNLQVKWHTEEQVNYGFNVLIEYEYAITKHLTLAPRVSFVSLERAGPSSIYGLNVGYRLLK